MGIGGAAGEQGYHAVAHVHLIVQIAPLQFVETPVELRAHPVVANLRQDGAGDELAVETADDVEVDARGVGR